tara:strand:+ start:6236 stop:7171 length:936 start_codon:yes stop_codon:yes gene_type:complete
MATGFATTATSQAADTELAVFIPELWTDAVRASFKKNLVLASVGTDLSSLAAGGGDTINIPSVADVPNVVAKAPHVAFDYTSATEDSLSLALTTHNVTGTMVEDMGAIQSSSDLLSMYSDSIGYKLALGFDTNVEAALALTTECINIAGNTVAKTIDALTLAHISKVALENDCPLNECTLVLNPTLYASLFRIDDFIHISKTGIADAPNGSVGSVMGMNVVLSNNITSTNHNDAVDSDDGALNNANVLGGFVVHNSALVYGFSQAPRVQAEYSVDHLATKLIGDSIGGAKLVQDASQTKCWGIVEEGTTAW